MQGIGFPSRNGKFFGMILFTAQCLRPYRRSSFKSWMTTMAEGQSYDGPHHPNGQGGHGEQRFQRGNQQHQPQQQSADGKGP